MILTQAQHPRFVFTCITLVTLACTTSADAGVSIDRTRAIYTEKDKALSLTISNNSETQPYLAQSWIENDQGKKVASPFMVLPPLQRLEPKQDVVIRLVKLPETSLPNDKESVFYLNVLEVPPKSDKENTLQIAIKSKIKLFYRPAALPAHPKSDPARELRLTVAARELTLSNPSPYYISIATLKLLGNAKSEPVIDGVMVPPKGDAKMTLPTATFTGITLNHVNDYGGQNTVKFQCEPHSCSVQPEEDTQ